MTIRSIFTLPIPFIRFSKLRTPNTNILEKSILHSFYLYYFKILKEKTNVETLSISPDIDESDLPQYSLQKIQHHTLSRNSDTIQSMESVDQLHLLLQKSIPTLKTLMETFVPRYKHVYSYMAIIDILEPFSIYSENISVYVIKQIREQLKRNIDAYNNANDYRGNLFKSMILEKYKGEWNFEKSYTFLVDMLREKNDLEIFQESYLKPKPIPEHNQWFTSEIILKMESFDQYRIFMNMMRISQLSLFSPDEVLPNYFDEQEKETVTEFSNAKCIPRVITKKYKSIAALNADNGKEELEYDKEYDFTDYTLLAKFRKEQPELDSSSFLSFIIENLVSKFHYSREMATDLAKTLIAKRKLVKDGEYAILEILPELPSHINSQTLSEKEQKEIKIESDMRKRIQYYSRIKNKWEYIPELDEFSFMDMSTLICNLQDTCYKKDKKNTCETPEMTLHRLHESDKDRIRSEFKNRYILSLENTKSRYELQQDQWLKWISKEKEIKETNLLLYDIRAWDYGKLAVTQTLIESPYTKLRDVILQKNVDFVTKQGYIILFSNMFCRDPIVNESSHENVHWKYCKETNIPLLPVSIYLLAKAYQDGNYAVILDRLCNTIGKLSDDGDSYIDPYSGYILRKIEGREEGGEWSGQSETEEDWGKENDTIRMNEMIVKKTHKNEIYAVYQDPTLQFIYNQISAICRNVYIPGEEIKKDMMELCKTFLAIKSIFPSAEQYKKVYDEKIKRREKDPKLKKPDDFSLYNKKNHIMITILSVLIVIQTIIPDMPVKKTYPGCVRSFYGYPLDTNASETSTIQYFSCMVRKMYAENKNEKNLVPYKDGDLESKLTALLNDTLLKQPKVMELYGIKRKYILENAQYEPEIPVEINVSRQWTHFLPPTFDFSIPAISLQTISPKGTSSTEIQNIYRVKNIMFSLAIVEYIRDIIKQKNILFQTKSGYPFLVNACCEEILRIPSMNTIHYFMEEDAIIQNYVKFLWKVSFQLNKFQQDFKASFLVKERKDPIEKPDSLEIEKKQKQNQHIYMSFDVRIFYEAMIYYGKFDQDIYPIPKDLTEMFPEKPDGIDDEKYDPKTSIENKIEYLSHHKFKMDAKKLIHLMNVVNIRNRVEIPYSMDISLKTYMFSAIEYFETQNQDILKNPIYPLFSNDAIPIDFDSKDKEEMEEIQELQEELEHSNRTEEEDQQKLRKMQQVFKEKNKKMQETIHQKIMENNSEKISEREYTKVFQIIYHQETFQDVPITNITQYTKSILYSFGILFPSFLLTKTDPIKSAHKYWNLLPQDQVFLKEKLNMNAMRLKPFQNDSLLIPILQEIISHRSMESLFSFLDYCSCFITKTSQNQKDDSIRNVYFELYLFCIHSVCMIYLELVENKDIFRVILSDIQHQFQEELVETRRENEQNSKLEMNEFDSQLEMMEIDIRSVQVDQYEEIQQKVSDLLLAMVRTLKTGKQVNVKEPIMMSYAEIMTKIDYSRDREKQNIKNYFKEMNTEERKAEIILKKLHLGQFYVDLKKINKYGQNERLFGQADEGEKEDDLEEMERNKLSEINKKEFLENEMVEMMNLDHNELETSVEEWIYSEPVDENNNLDDDDRNIDLEDDFTDIQENAFEDMGDGNDNYY